MDELTFVFGIDGSHISCHVSGKDNLPEDPFGFGLTRKEALEDLMSRLDDELEG